MLREHCKVGMKVVFGRPNGEKTVGEVEEINETKAKIKALESRGDGNRGSEEHRTKKQPAGSVWDAPFENMEPLNNNLLEALRSLPPKYELLLDYLEVGSETLIDLRAHFPRRTGPGTCMYRDEEIAILQTISTNYRNRESIAKSYWKHRRLRTTAADFEADSLLSYWKDHNHRLGLLFKALGRPVSLAVSQAWEDNRRIMCEIDKEFEDPTDKMKARQHWFKICLDIFPHDYDHQERINIWNERKLSKAWIEAGLNKTGPSPTNPPEPSIPRLFPLELTLEQRRRAWKKMKEARLNPTSGTSEVERQSVGHAGFRQ